jgi:PAS domain S-box-containing protein
MKEKNFRQLETPEGTTLLLDEYYLYLHSINEVKNYAIFLMTPDGIIKSWNQGCINIKQYTDEETVGNHYSMLFPDDLVDQGNPWKELEIAKKEGRFEEENRRKRKDGSVFWAGVTLTAIYDKSGNVVALTKVTHDLTKRKELEEDLTLKNEQLKKINTDLDNFIYTASHDLKAPIANIEGLLNTLRHDLPAEKYNKIVELAKISVQRLKGTIKDLTDITKIQKNIEEERFEEIDIEDLVKEVTESIQHDLGVKCPNLKFDLNVMRFRFSKVNLKSIIYNLVSNAIKYRSEERKCEILIRTTQCDPFIKITVADNGIGLPENYQAKLFKMFKRMHSHVEGTGIGLYIVKRIVENTGGKIEVESTPNQGTAFHVFLQSISME